MEQKFLPFKSDFSYSIPQMAPMNWCFLFMIGSCLTLMTLQLLSLSK